MLSVEEIFTVVRGEENGLRFLKFNFEIRVRKYFENFV